MIFFLLACGAGDTLDQPLPPAKVEARASAEPVDAEKEKVGAGV